MTYPALHICQSRLGIEVCLGDIENLYRNMKHGSLIHGQAAAFAGIWSKFRCTRESSDFVLSLVTTDPALYICQSHLPIETG